MPGMPREASRYRLSIFVSVVVIAVVAGAVATQETTSDVEAAVVAGGMDAPEWELARFGETLFDDGRVAEAVSTKFGGPAADVVPDRVSVEAVPDSAVFRVIGHDPDPETAAAIANTAADAFVSELDAAGEGPGGVMAPADPNRLEQPWVDHEEPGPLVPLVLELGVGILVGLAFGFALRRRPSRSTT